MVLTGMSSASAEIRADGECHTIRATGEPISVILAREGIVLGTYDTVSPSLDERVTAGTEIVVDRVEYVERTTAEPIGFETVYAESSLLPIGESRVEVDGENGRRETTVVEKLVNGVLVSVSPTETTEFAPISEVVAVGTALSEPYSRREGDFRLKNGVPTEYIYRLSGKVTAYTAPEGAGTYSGRPLEIGTVAVDPNEIPFGSELYICSKDGRFVYGYAVAADTGHLTDVIADVFMGTTDEHFDEACRWGAQDAYVYVLSVGDNSISWL
ncbi:MAG: G5 domain-containing protein [Bacteroides sp.]|nr:G5 domain-containing protein [Eubacterium sp.]MCM1418512.1 G5 domain-containing protein [Roseburia sp.]MCM1462532.1 G5 domain-containing protein [Bacteroides sp.]